MGWRLPAALGLDSPSELVAFVGGGGKTTLMFALAAALDGRTVTTTTTRIFAAQMEQAPACLQAADLSALENTLDAHTTCLVIGRVEGEKALGVDPSLPGLLLARPDVDFVLVEADGSRMRPVKAPADHEPVVPPETTLLVAVAGIDALERPLDEAAHRPELVRKLIWQAPGEEATLTADDRLTPYGLAWLLAHEEGGRKNVPPGCRVAIFLNKVDSQTRLDAAREVARYTLVNQVIGRVIMGSLQSPSPVHEVHRPVTAVILAAGKSSRMGRNKLLLPWGSTTVLGETIENALSSTVSDVVVVTGHEAQQVDDVARQAGIGTIHNNRYEAGMLSSLQQAVRTVPDSTAAVIVALGDQPMVDSSLYDRLLEAYRQGWGTIIALSYQGRRGNPVLIDRRHFAELLTLPEGTAPRDLLARHPDAVHLVVVDAEEVLHDLDRPEQYERWRPGGIVAQERKPNG